MYELTNSHVIMNARNSSQKVTNHCLLLKLKFFRITTTIGPAIFQCFQLNQRVNILDYLFFFECLKLAVPIPIPIFSAQNKYFILRATLVINFCCERKKPCKMMYTCKNPIIEKLMNSMGTLDVVLDVNPLSTSTRPFAIANDILLYKPGMHMERLFRNK